MALNNTEPLWKCIQSPGSHSHCYTPAVLILSLLRPYPCPVCLWFVLLPALYSKVWSLTLTEI